MKRGRPPKIKVDREEPKLTCYDCGMKYGSFKCGQLLWDRGTCGACGKKDVKVCSPMHFGYFLAEWKEMRDNPQPEEEKE
jgi:hypothetical protein